jgi:hypothetical protein
MTEETKNTSIPVGDIRVQMGEEAIVFNPTDDITGKEVSLILQMFLNGLGYRGDGLIDFGSFIVKHNLQRHFARIENERKEEQEGS